MIYSFSIFQGGLPVASASSSVLTDSLREIQRYASMYAQDGPVDIVGNNRASRAALKKHIKDEVRT